MSHSVNPARWLLVFEDARERTAAGGAGLRGWFVVPDRAQDLLAASGAGRIPAAAPSQRLLRAAIWDAEQVVADVQRLLTDRLGDSQADSLVALGQAVADRSIPARHRSIIS